jgi:hypothetical protein
MMRAAGVAGLVFAFAAGLAHAQEGEQPDAVQASALAPAQWELAATAYRNMPRGEDSYTSGIVTADHEALHLEARSNYEAIDAQSAFVGWTFSGGESIKYEVTPLLGGVTGKKHGAIAGAEATFSYGRWDYYIEAEYVRDLDVRDESFIYIWSELGFRPVEWLRAGIAAQRTRVYGEGREVQRGGFVQATYDKFTLGAYYLNPGASDQVGIMSLGVAF